MRKFTERYKLTAHSLKEIREGLKAIVKRLADQDVKCDGHVIAQANVINLAALYLIKHVDQDQIVIDLIPELERHKASAEPLPIQLLPARPGRKRAAYPVNQSVVDSDALSNDRIPRNHSAPKRGR